jgi:hypothetical protein
MKSTYVIVLVSTTLVLALASLTVAEVPQLINYQGRLTDDLGNPVNGTVSMTFTIYDAAEVGEAKWTEIHPSVDVVDGLFSVALGAGSPAVPIEDDVFSGSVRYLGIRVGSDLELTPRTPLVSSAYAYRVSTVDGADGGKISRTVALDSLEIGSATQDGHMLIFQDGAVDPCFRFHSPGSVGGVAEMFDENGSAVSEWAADNDGEGGLFRVYGNIGHTSYFFVDGNHMGSGDPWVQIYGSASASYFLTDETGSEAVQLPQDAVEDTEILDEPGVAGDIQVDLYYLSDPENYEGLVASSMTVPDYGYILALANCDVRVTHTNGTMDMAALGVSSNTTEVSPGQGGSIYVPGAAASGVYIMSASYSGLFEITSLGTHTFYFLGQELSGDVGVVNKQLTLIYFPTAYGTVTEAMAASSGLSGDVQIRESGLTEAEIAAERLESMAFNAARIERELARMQEQIEILNAEAVAEMSRRTVDREGDR